MKYIPFPYPIAEWIWPGIWELSDIADMAQGVLERQGVELECDMSGLSEGLT